MNLPRKVHTKWLGFFRVDTIYKTQEISFPAEDHMGTWNPYRAKGEVKAQGENPNAIMVRRSFHLCTGVAPILLEQWDLLWNNREGSHFFTFFLGELLDRFRSMREIRRYRKMVKMLLKRGDGGA